MGVPLHFEQSSAEHAMGLTFLYFLSVFYINSQQKYCDNLQNTRWDCRVIPPIFFIFLPFSFSFNIDIQNKKILHNLPNTRWDCRYVSAITLLFSSFFFFFLCFFSFFITSYQHVPLPRSAEHTMGLQRLFLTYLILFTFLCDTTKTNWPYSAEPRWDGRALPITMSKQHN